MTQVKEIHVELECVTTTQVIFLELLWHEILGLCRLSNGKSST